MAKTTRAASTKARAKTPQFVVVRTEHKGLFCGELTFRSADDSRVTLKDARQIVYFEAKTKGSLGIAGGGVSRDSRVSPKAPSISLRGVIEIMEATPQAVAAWEAEPWR
jgi:hypothetical protein